MVISVQLLKYFTRKKYRIADGTLFILHFSAPVFNWNAESVQYFSVCYNLEVEQGGKWGRERSGSGVAD